MPTFEDPAADASEAQQTLRGLAHATRLDNPQETYSVLGSLTAAAASLERSLHEVASFHQRNPHHPGDPRQASAVYRVSWDLHRVADMLQGVVEAIDHAHEAEAFLTYHRVSPPTAPAPQHSTERGIGL